MVVLKNVGIRHQALQIAEKRLQKEKYDNAKGLRIRHLLAKQVLQFLNKWKQNPLIGHHINR
ncbi:hypothetical protein VYH81_06130 [Streptococcus anginosus]|jgi:hypothetical protein|uniref:Uncharacterized protein n=1 Tax=Streptococcus anginosus TaxID=1328 RepID=A0AAW5TFE7_STRAP|nr:MULTISPECIES: hypothetical protein [Streptococcus]MCW0928867.1 hypothetical protein [Streptococcus anginosus]MCW0934110.1 hypothetical protein [Streptococcus anginosus]MCW0946394.1 hypothetical protein [Streptococcus anginosus]MCW0948314.1 hypothetical protein [Streptococcus anginosus]MCW0950013.1 hypothetical protein [Streptococcus anginosus]